MGVGSVVGGSVCVGVGVDLQLSMAPTRAGLLAIYSGDKCYMCNHALLWFTLFRAIKIPKHSIDLLF